MPYYFGCPVFKKLASIFHSPDNPITTNTRTTIGAALLVRTADIASQY